MKWWNPFKRKKKKPMSHIPEVGDVYLATRRFTTNADVAYKAGDKFTLVEKTDESPFGFQSSIMNWVVDCKHFHKSEPERVWSGIYSMIESGWIVWSEDDTKTATQE